MAVREVAAKPVHERLRLVPQPDEAQAQSEPVSPPAPPKEAARAEPNNEAILSTFAAISRILAARLILLLAGLGAFVLAALVIPHPTPASICAMAIYDALIFLPLVALAMRKG